MGWFYQQAFFLLLTAVVAAEPMSGEFKPPPTRPSTGANVIIEDQETLDACDTEQICVQGRLANTGAKTAQDVKVRIEIGGTKQGHPRATLIQKVDTPTMAPGDRQEFYFTIDRKIPSKNAKGEEKLVEVGKYNFRLVPVWGQPKVKTLTVKKSKHP